MTNNRFISRAICLLLVLACIFAVGLTVFALGGGEHDLSRPNSNYTEVITSADILEYYLGEELLTQEREYLEKYGEITLKYDTGITTAYVQTEYFSSTRTLSLTAYAYKYMTEDRTEVVFVPTTATLGNRCDSFAPLGDKYVVTFSDVDEDEGLYAEIVYTLDFVISAEELNSVINKAYTDAPYWIRCLADYERAKAEYDESLPLYEEYLEELSLYRQDYEEYLSERKIYDEALKEYENYLEQLRRYNQAVDDYNSYDDRLLEYGILYAEYREYLVALNTYEKSLEQYNQYLSTLEKIKAQLLAVDTAKTNMTMDRNLYSAIMGSLVDSVLENKDVLTSSIAGVSGEVIDLAGDCTENLRALLKSYFSLKTEEEKYSYYTVNYEAFRDNFAGLLKALDNLYRNKRVRGILISEEKDVKYIILVSQLYIIANALSDTTIYSVDGSYAFDDTYTIENRTPLDILEYVEYLKDTDSATPLSSGYPEKMKAPTEPKKVNEPVKPEVVVIPAYPEEVQPPEPIRDAPTAPDEVEEPICPEFYEHSPEVLALTEAYLSGLFEERPSVSEGLLLRVEEKLTKKLFGVTTVSVVFCDTDGQSIYFTEVDTGTRAEFMGEYPTKEQDEASVYTFSHWVDENGERADLSGVSDNLVLYPAFSEEARRYEITFVVEGEEYKSLFDYGSIPACPIEPKKEDDNLYRYDFSSWDKPVTQVNGDAVYTATFTGSYLMSLNGRGAYVTVSDGYIIADCTGAFSTEYDASYLIEKARREHLGVTLITGKGTFTVSYTTVLSMYNNGHTVFVPSYVVSNKNGEATYYYSLSVKGAGNTGYRINAVLPVTSSSERLRLSYDNSGVKTYLPFSLNDGSIELYIHTEVKYTLCEEYSLTQIPSELVELNINNVYVAPGETVNLSVDVPNGVKLTKVYIITDAGEEIEVIGNTFVMPKGDCTVGVVAERILYTVTFVDGLRTIATKTYYYGDTVVLPTDPVKLSDGTYSYTFAGWSPKIDTVTGDVTYTARFNKTLLPPKEEHTGLQVSEGVMRIIIIAIVVASLFIIGFIALIVLIIVKIVKRVKKRRKND